jgi:hypothetical protein
MPDLSPRDRLNHLIIGYWLSQGVYVVAKLGIADLLKAGPLHVDVLAEKTGMHAKSLHRLLRALASVGVFEETHDHVFASTPTADLLRGDVEGSQKAMAVMMGEEHYAAWGELLEAVRTGRETFTKIYGKPVFEYLSEHPEKAAIFDDAMVSVHGRESSAFVDVYDLSNAQVVADIGGGNGSLLCTILARYPKMMGTLYDLPHVVGRANARVEAAGLADRMHLVDGDFFESVPVGADVYTLRHIIHDWEDDRATRILQNVRAAMKPTAKLLVLESVIPTGNEPSFGKLLDLTMLVIPGGQERTADWFRRLFQASGFRLTRIVPTPAEICVVEGEPI